MNVLTNTKRFTHRKSEVTVAGGRDSWGHGHTAAFNMENQQGPAGQHRELCSMSGGSLGSNPGLLHCRWILYHLSHQGSPLEWVGSP